MKQLLLTTLAFVVVAGAASAQTVKRLLDSVMIHSDATFDVDRPMFKTFGFGGEYTDSIDYRLPAATRERELPGAPPSSLYVMFDAQHGTEPAWIDRDVRGVPDSVASGAVQKFSLRYVLEIQRGIGPVITLVMPRALPAGIDSINFRDIIGGSGGVLFNETIADGPDSVTITNEGLHTIAMIVYFDASEISTGINEPLAEVAVAGLLLAPNPARQSVTIATELAPGSRVVVSDLRGTPVVDDRIAYAARAHTLALDGLADGMYFVRALSPDGAIVAENRLIVRR